MQPDALIARRASHDGEAPKPIGRQVGRVLALLAGMLLAPAVAVAADGKGAAEICKRSEAIERPARNSAGPAPKGCDALELYDGVGGAPDYRAARACSLNPVGEPDIAFPPEAILSMIFANGDGVARNDDLAIAYACAAGGAPAETSGRVEHLIERKRQGAAVKDRFDFCDDITSGMMQGFCSARDAKKTSVGRDAELGRLTAALKSPAKAAYDKLRKAFETYRDAVADNEVDLSGTARGAMAIGAREDEEDAFLVTLREILGSGSAPSAQTLAVADASLNAAYKQVQAEPQEDRWGTVTKAGIKTTQRAWLAYRDAFTAFAAAAASQTPGDRLAAILTTRRAESLMSFVDE